MRDGKKVAFEFAAACSKILMCSLQSIVGCVNSGKIKESFFLMKKELG
jgi:hypothetical protein